MAPIIAPNFQICAKNYAFFPTEAGNDARESCGEGTPVSRGATGLLEAC